MILDSSSPLGVKIGVSAEILSNAEYRFWIKIGHGETQIISMSRYKRFYISDATWTHDHWTTARLKVNLILIEVLPSISFVYTVDSLAVIGN